MDDEGMDYHYGLITVAGVSMGEQLDLELQAKEDWAEHSAAHRSTTSNELIWKKTNHKRRFIIPTVSVERTASRRSRPVESRSRSWHSPPESGSLALPVDGSAAPESGSEPSGSSERSSIMLTGGERQ
ncbi:hypothetical protein INR49_027615 [Caranx melampygus]|nr:hypothetical protein INR49_027615 [Caranx melampygus]